MLYDPTKQYARLETLGITFCEPSPAMRAWITADMLWYDDKEFIEANVGDSLEAVTYADNNAANAAN